MRIPLFSQRSIERQLADSVEESLNTPYKKVWRGYVDLHREVLEGVKFPEERVQVWASDKFTRRTKNLGVLLEIVVSPNRRQAWQEYCYDMATVDLAQAVMLTNDEANKSFLLRYKEKFPKLATGIIMPNPSRPVRS